MSRPANLCHANFEVVARSNDNEEEVVKGHKLMYLMPQKGMYVGEDDLIVITDIHYLGSNQVIVKCAADVGEPLKDGVERVKKIFRKLRIEVTWERKDLAIE